MSATGTSASSRAAGTNPHPQHDLLRRVRDARQAAVSWLSNRVGDDGEPVGWADGNAWWRAPWALCLGGAPDVAAALIGWTERNALTDAGDYRPWPYAPRGESSPVYHLSPIAIAAWLLARYDTAAAINGTLEHFQDQRTGGAYDNRDFAGDDLQENLKTAQLGVSALVTGRQDIAQGVRNWLEHNLADQPELPTRFYPARRNGGLVTEFAERDAFLRVVDWTAPRQAYFHSGIAAAFLAGFAQQTGDGDALELGRQYLRMSTEGTPAQFDDHSSVQICKFGWGAAAMLTADPAGGHLPWVERMARWFVDGQRPDGAWAPSSFMTPKPQLFDLYWKTAEHLMELAYIEVALYAHG
jgi:hypothetical protein